MEDDRRLGDQVSELIAEIAAATRSRARHRQVNTAVAQMDQVQQNAALVEQASASSLTFQEQAGRMSDLVARFKVPDEPAVARPRRASAPSRAARRCPRPSRSRGCARCRRVRRRARPQAQARTDEWKEF